MGCQSTATINYYFRTYTLAITMGLEYYVSQRPIPTGIREVKSPSFINFSVEYGGIHLFKYLTHQTHSC
jgi:hypothetical protein